MSALLEKIIGGILGAFLKFFGDRADKKKADDAQREGGAREVEAESQKEAIDASERAEEIRNRPAADSDTLDDRMRAPANRRQRD